MKQFAMRAGPVMAISLMAAGLTACDKTLEPPGDAGSCYHMAYDANKQIKFNLLARNVPNMETCAAQLEMMRLRFLRMGGSAQEVTGSYQQSFIFVKRPGIFVAQKWGGPKFPALVRSGDGRLVVPGAVAIARE